jgi:aminocarboxymuconate-semialdehyde decarboxylase
LVAIDNPISPREYVGKFWVDSATHDEKLLRYVLEMQGSKRVTLGTDYPFPLGDLEVGRFITQMGLAPQVVEDIFCNATLAWLKLDRNQFV